MSQPIINQPWEDVASDVTAAIELAVQPLIKRAADDIYAGLLDTTQDYLRDNLAFNIASRIDAAEREARDARQLNAELLHALVGVMDVIYDARADDDVDCSTSAGGYLLGDVMGDAFQAALAAIAKAKGGAA